MSHKTTNIDDTNSGSAFERFWKRAGKHAKRRSFTFVTQPGAKTISENGSEGQSPDGKKTSDPVSDEDSKSTKRRQQIYDAQRRHRNRKNEYIRSLEGELDKLRSRESVVSVEKDRLSQQNAHMRMLLDRHKTIPDSSNGHVDANRSLHGDDAMAFASVDVHNDPQIGHERLFLQADATDSTQQDEIQRESTWLAVDFILSLEWPCRTHIPHPIMSTPDKPYVPCGAAAFNGHNMTTTSTIVGGSILHTQFSHTPMPSSAGIDKEILEKWQIPYTEIEKLVKLSENLELDDDLITPAQAYAAIKSNCAGIQQLERVLAVMKRALVDMSHCEGFGAVIDTQRFKTSLESALQQTV